MPKTSSSPALAYNLFGHPSLPPVVLVNGMGGVQAAWLHVVRLLCVNFHVVTYDHRGSGDSEVVDAPATMRTYAQDLVRLLDHLGFAQASFVGLSFGGRVLQELALGWPERIIRLVLGGTSCGGRLHVLGDPEAHAALEQGASADEKVWVDVLAPALFGSAYVARFPERIASLARWRARHPSDARGLARQWEAYKAFDVSGELSAIQKPVLVLHGTDDRISPIRNGEVLAAGLPRARLVRLEGVGHSPNVEVPDHMVELVRDFFGGGGTPIRAGNS